MFHYLCTSYEQDIIFRVKAFLFSKGFHRPIFKPQSFLTLNKIQLQFKCNAVLSKGIGSCHIVASSLEWRMSYFFHFVIMSSKSQIRLLQWTLCLWVSQTCCFDHFSFALKQQNDWPPRYNLQYLDRRASTLQILFHSLLFWFMYPCNEQNLVVTFTIYTWKHYTDVSF